MPLPKKTIQKFAKFLGENNKKVGFQDFFARPEEHQLAAMMCDFIITIKKYEKSYNQLLNKEKKQHRSEAAQAFVEAQKNIINASSEQMANMIDFLYIV